jgi:RNase H-fold protein (predicted Holliday junction resolvase)
LKNKTAKKIAKVEVSADDERAKVEKAKQEIKKQMKQSKAQKEKKIEK